MPKKDDKFQTFLDEEIEVEPEIGVIDPLNESAREVFDKVNTILQTKTNLTREQAAYYTKMAAEALLKISVEESSGAELPMSENEEACFSYIKDTLGVGWVKKTLLNAKKG